MRITLDCEFTELESPQLLSIGLVAASGAEFYGELPLKPNASTFVEDTVAPQFGRVPTRFNDEPSLAAAVARWLDAQGPERHEVLYDYHADADLLESLLVRAGLTESFASKVEPTHVGYLLGDEGALAAMEQSWRNSFAQHGIERHHALADARALNAAYLAVHKD